MSKKPSIGILYICTGKYVVFWEDFYLSMEKNFIADAEKHYFVFTDAPEIAFEKEHRNIHRIYQENLGWPFNTLMRFHMFLKIEKELSVMDYLFFFNANLLILKPISAEAFLPHFPERLLAALSPGFYTKKRKQFTYEDNPRSMAYIAPNEGDYYFAGGLNGGITEAFLAAMKSLRGAIDTDTKNGIVAKWHDESHWNRYLVGRTDVKILSPSYLYPEDWVLPMEAIILIKDKTKHGGHDALRNTRTGQLLHYKQLAKKVVLTGLHFFKHVYPFENKKAVVSTIDYPSLKHKHFLLLTIAYNNSDSIRHQHAYLKANLAEDFCYIVVDNSTIPEISAAIEAYCRTAGIPYVKLPANPFLGNPSKSHGAALNWAYRNIIKKTEPAYFGFIDHDIFPFRTTVITSLIKDTAYGLIQKRNEKWYLWPGYCFFHYAAVRSKYLNFMPSRGLDTGGSNYRALYSKMHEDTVPEVPHTYIDIDEKRIIPAFDAAGRTVERIGDWLHLMNVSNWNNKGADKLSDIAKTVELTNALCTTSPDDSQKPLSEIAG